MKPFDNSNASMLADGAKTRPDFTGFVPIESFRAIKLRAVIEKEVLWVCSVFEYDTIHC